MTTSTRLKTVALVSLVVQNSALVLILRYSRTIPGPKYYSTTAVVICEIIKFFISLIVLLRTESCSPSHLFQTIFGPSSLWVKMTYPAILYTVQNNLQYAAASLLDAATFQVTYQMKILTTALFSVILLGKSLNFVKWASLVLLTAGIALVQLPANNTPTSGKDNVKEGQAEPAGMADQFLGLIVVGIACCLSGLAGVYFEKILKSPKSVTTGTAPPPRTSLWVRNVQLSFFSIVAGLVLGVGVAEGEGIRRDGFFYGYNIYTWMAILCQAIGGIIVALVVKYADNILKGFATSISIILSALVSVFLFDFHISTYFVMGAGMVIAATYLYSLPSRTALPTQRKGSSAYDTQTPMVLKDGRGGRRRSAHAVEVRPFEESPFLSKAKSEQSLVMAPILNMSKGSPVSPIMDV